MNTETQTIRLPRPEYKGQNGFLPQFMDPEQITDQNLPDALERQLRFEFFLEHQKRDVPDFEAMEAEVDRKDDEASFNRQIESLKISHYEDLDKLYDMNMEEYAESLQEQYSTRDHTSQQQEIYEEERMAIVDLYETERARLQIRWHDRFEQLRHSYLQQLVPLGEARKNAAAEEERQRKLLEKMFPQSKEDFDSKPTETKLRAARFLVADPARQERLLNDYGWAWRQVQPLIDIFKKDVSGRNFFQASFLTFLLDGLCF
ncbi:hypothetical protein CVT25_010056 [Psilocybe cyanescens]|uniref:Uncharacterized protein n=1 Tax=Psilocybe cyanescens TaxID=93625 RepID=A0A409X3E5_PSICY|nr:hypothetical protein CVT25_010056 [Psilocybe cyanescens]